MFKSIIIKALAAVTLVSASEDGALFYEAGERVHYTALNDVALVMFKES